MSDMSVAARFDALGALIAEYQWLWREQPFKIARPGWMARAPELARRCFALEEEAWPRLLSDNAALIDWVSEDVPALKGLRALIEFDVGNSRLDPGFDGFAIRNSRPDPGVGYVDWEVPGRKWAQIGWFAEAAAPLLPVTEWCAGKGHLGRLVGARWGLPVDSIEIDGALCEAGQSLSRRARVAQRFVCADVLEGPLALAGRHVLALHACGHLHRRLVRDARALGVAALDVAPCCYYRGDDCRAVGGLPLSADDLRLAVTETATAGAREVRLRDQAHAWRLGYARLRAQVTGAQGWAGIKPIKTPWLSQGFGEFCRHLAARDGVVLPDSIAWDEAERAGWVRHGEVMRLSAPRFAFRRALEVWLACSLALELQAQGYEAGVTTFCPAALTPRNLRVFGR